MWRIVVVGVGAGGAGRVRRSRRAVAHGAPRLLLAGGVQRGCRSAHGQWRCRCGCRALAPTPAADEEAVTGAEATAHALEAHDVAGVEALLLDVAAPPLGEHVALAAGPVRVPEPPRLAGLVLEGQQQALVAAVSGPVAAEREVPLRVLLGDHKAVELSHVAGRERLLEQVLPLVLVVVLVVVQVGVHGHPPRPRLGVPLGEMVHSHSCLGGVEEC